MTTRVAVPLNDLAREHAAMADDITAAIDAVLASGWYVHGSRHDAFERGFAEYLGATDVVGVANGTDALELALRAVGCSPGDEVVTAANAGFYTSAAALAIGAVPVYVDIDPATLSIDPAAAAAALTDRTRAVVVTHLYGKAAHMGELLAVAAGIPVIEDCAQAHGARWNGRHVGTLGAAGCFSFYPTKNLGGVGDGGAISLGDPELAARLRRLRQYGWVQRYEVAPPGGRNSRLDELQAAVLSVKLARLDELNDRRRRVVDAYRVAAAAGVTVVHEPGPDFVAHLCVVRTADRDALAKRMASAGVATSVHYPVLDPDQPIMAETRHVAHDLTHSRAAVGEILTVPCHPFMSDEEIARVAEVLAA